MSKAFEKGEEFVNSKKTHRIRITDCEDQYVIYVKEYYDPIDKRWVGIPDPDSGLIERAIFDNMLGTIIQTMNPMYVGTINQRTFYNEGSKN